MPTPSPLPDRSRLYSALYLGLAALCFIAGGILITSAGLPDRADLNATFALPDGRAAAPEIHALAPPLNLLTVDGGLIAPEALSGQIVVLNFWATWCAPCQAEMPALQMLAERYPSQLTVIGINAGESAAAVKGWRERFGLTFPLLLDPDGTAAHDYRLRGQPTTVIVAPNGRIHDIIYGPADIHALARAVTALLPAVEERRSP